jgi:hypothetical protein
MTPEWTPSGASGERRLRHILSLLAAAPAPSSGQLCAVAARVVDVAGAGVTLEDRLNRTLLCASDAIAAEVEELSFTLGEGPGIDAHRVGSPVSEPDLARPRRARWPSFTSLAVGAGAAAIFAFPLRVGGIRLGALTLYQPRAGRLEDDQHADALVMADVVVHAVLADQAGAPPGDLAGELDALSSTRADVHQASGMVSVQLGASVADALVRLRAHAYAEGRALSDVAGDVIAGRLRLSE